MRAVLFVGALFTLFVQAQTPPAAYPPLPDSVAVDANIPYDSHKQTVVDVFYPKAGAAGGAKRPAVVVIHGGGWRGGTKESVYPNFVQPYLDKGFVVANVEYRLSGVAPAPAAVNDALKAANWFRENARRWNVDTKRIVVTGGSAGGHLALMVGLTPKSAKLGPAANVAAVINFYGITDVEDQIQGPNQREYAVQWVPEQPERLQIARRLSPLTYARKDVPPVLTIHGNADATVPYEHGVRITKALRDAGADAEMISVPEGKHGFPADQMKSLYVEIFDFLAKRGILNK